MSIHFLLYLLLESDAAIAANGRKLYAVTYGSESFTGIEYSDTVALSPRMVIKDQSIGVARKTHGFGNNGIDGILGYNLPFALVTAK
ncbi:hypothetical protein PM082_017084 [Marasmius tenuissimus]|nr:hypothetical protein PM082_017084 [Marasmius tenuissimus]